MVGYIVRGLMVGKRFLLKLELIKGTHWNPNTHTSIIHFSINRSTTQYVKSVLRPCAIENGMTHVRLDEYAFNSNLPYMDGLNASQMQRYRHVFKSNGYLYSVFGGMIDGIEGFDKYLVILMIRDPRGVLTSGYYALAYNSSPIPYNKSNKYESFYNVEFMQRGRM